RPHMLWMVDTASPALPLQRERRGLRAGARSDTSHIRHQSSVTSETPPPARSAGAGIPPLRDYTAERKRQDAWNLLGFCTDAHPMTLHAGQLSRFRLVRSPELAKHVGKRVLMAGMYTTGKPVHTAQHEPMQFATFDDGDGLVECVLFPDVYRERSHVLFDQGPFIFRGI